MRAPMRAPPQVFAAALLLMGAYGQIASSQEVGQAEDQTGTNPVNFQRELRFNNEYIGLNTLGDGSQNLTTVEFRSPFASGNWQWRIRTRRAAVSADFDNDGIDDVDDAGLGDTDMRFITVPVLNMQERYAIAYGVELFLDTASDPTLGSGTTALGPQIFYVKFLEGGLFAPGLQYKFSVDEDVGRRETDQILIDLNFLKMADDQQSWFFTDPQLVIDRETDTEFSIVDFEFGWMMSKWTELRGHSFYVRPSVGLGADRLTDYSIEIGYKIVGF
jgi:hypothetical protein